MKNRFTVVSAALVVGASIILTSPHAMADDSSSSGPTMPGPFTDSKLQGAVDQINDAESGAGLKLPISFSQLSGPSSNIFNYANWFVCSQTPKAGASLSSDSDITLTVRRPGTKCPSS